MTESYTTVRHLASVTMSLIPEGLDLPYFNNRENRDKHLLLLLPDECTNTCWWIVTSQLSRIISKIRSDVYDNMDSIPDGFYKRVMRALRNGTCKVYLWRVHSTVALNHITDSIKLLHRPEKKRDPSKSIAMECWAVYLKDHPELTCVISVNPNRFTDPARNAVTRTIRMWQRILRNSVLQENRKKAHIQYAKRNQALLDKRELFEVIKIANYSTHAVYEKFRLVPSNEWVLPTHALDHKGECKTYNQSGLVVKKVEKTGDLITCDT